MSASVKIYTLPGGERIVSDEDDTRVQARRCVWASSSR